MPTMRDFGISMRLVALVLCASAVQSVAQTYNVVDLGTLSGNSVSKAYALNNGGQATGMSSSPTAAIAVMFNGGKTTSISTLGSDVSVATAMNGSSQIAGSRRVAQTENVPGTTFTTLHSFTGADGDLSFAGLVQGKNGRLYGTTYYGGANNDGEVFQVTTTGKLKTVHSFCSVGDCADGEYSYAVLVEGADGNFYGTTYLGGSNDDGIVFKMSPKGALTTLHSFGGSDGSQPLAGLAEGSDGNSYGTTNLGGSHNAGTVFKITPSGDFTTLHSFCSKAACADGESSYAGLILANDGNLYGTTLAGGSYGYGTVFKISKSGAFSTLYSFCSQSGCADGQFPQIGLVQASNGNLYGATLEGGAFGSGIIFELKLSGQLTALYSICSQNGCPDGNYLYAPLTQAQDGNLYGIMQIGGANNSGTVFKMTLSGTLTTLYSFCSQPACADGQYPAAGLVQATNGNLYGTTADGGVHGHGTVFSIAP